MERKPDLVEHLIDIAIAVAGLALLVYLQRAGYQAALAEWVNTHLF